MFLKYEYWDAFSLSGEKLIVPLLKAACPVVHVQWVVDW